MRSSAGSPRRSLGFTSRAARPPARAPRPSPQSWLTPELAGVEAHPWLAPAIEAVRAETDPLTVTWSVLHTDPPPEAFVHDDGTGTTGLIDWSGAKRGPVLYDVASAVMYLGGPVNAAAFLTTYRTRGPLGRDEMLSLDAFRRFRWAVQSACFAWRLSVRDLTGIADDAGNWKGLNDARKGLVELGMDTA
jgi:Ser/Thr protein kinase RdoA (MazF antagonist)